MIDRLLAIIVLLLLGGFCALMISFIGRIDLAIVMIAVLLMAAYDLLFFSFRNKN